MDNEEKAITFNLTGHRQLWSGVVKFLENKLDELEDDPDIINIVDVESLKSYILDKQLGGVVSHPLNECWACEYADTVYAAKNSQHHTCDFCPLQPEVCRESGFTWFAEIENILDYGLCNSLTPEARERAIDLARQIRDATVEPRIKTK